MISKLPSWVLAGAWVLAFVAGVVNVVSLLGFSHEGLSHLTGNTTRLAEALSRGDWATLLHLAGLMGAFVGGTALSGFLIEDVSLQLGQSYGTALALETLLLAVAAPLLTRQNAWGLYACAAACGLQNAMVSTYSGAVVRTTHVSGMFTDLGIAFGHFLRRRSFNEKRLRLCAIVISGFVAGGVCGALGFRLVGYPVVWLGAGLTAAMTAAAVAARRRA